MYDIPSVKNVEKVIVDKNTVENHQEPLVIKKDDLKSRQTLNNAFYR